MRTTAYQAIVIVYNVLLLTERPYSINELAQQNNLTWRTTKKCLETLCNLGIVDWGRVSGEKRKYYMAVQKNNTKTEETK